MRRRRASWARRVEARLPHLVRRFLGSVLPAGPDQAAESWALAHLTDGEARLWRRMTGPDRRHGVAVARRVRAALGVGRREVGALHVATGREVDRALTAAALLHDVGKVESGLGTWGRVPTTLAILGLGRDRVEAWAARSGPLGRAGRYARHPVLGGLLLAGAGSDRLTVAWAAEHHLPAERWTVEREVGGLLKAADHD